LRPCRRVDDLLLRPLRLRSHVQVRSGKPTRQALSHRAGCDTSPAGTQAAGDSPPVSSRSRATHATRAPSLRLRRPQRVIRHDRAFFAWRSATRLEHCTAWPDDAGLPFSLVVVVRRRSWGSSAPFAGLIPLSGGLITLASHDARCRSTPLSLHASRRHFCRSGPTCRSCLLIRPD